MPDAAQPHLKVSQKADLRQRATLLARVQTVNLLKMGEPQIAELIRDIESDPLFEKLLRSPRREWKVIRFQPHPRTRLSGAFYEINEQVLSSDAPADVVRLLEEKKGVLGLVRRIGRDNFERHFLRVDEEEPPEVLSARLGLSPEEVKRVRDFLLAFSVRAEFFDPSSRGQSGTPGAPLPARRVVRLARLEVQPDGDAAFHFHSPHLARGRYDIQYDKLQAFSDNGGLGPEEKRHLRAFIRRLELVNWRQNTLFRILDMLCHAQKGYIAGRDTLKRTPLSQRQMARRLSVAPSTVNRAIQDRSVVMPWGEEVLLQELFCSRKDLCVDMLGALEAEDAAFDRKTDVELRENLRQRLGFSVPRRTVNTYRRLLGPSGGVSA